jgi:hypothetical protein
MNLAVAVLFDELAKAFASDVHFVAVQKLRQVAEILGVPVREPLFESVEFEGEQMLQ